MIIQRMLDCIHLNVQIAHVLLPLIILIKCEKQKNYQRIENALRIFTPQLNLCIASFNSDRNFILN